MPRFKQRDFVTSLDFNGTTSTVSATHVASQLLTTGMTLSAWIRPRSIGENSAGMIFNKSTATNGADGYYFSMQTSERVNFRVNAGTSRNCAVGAVPLNVWTHVAVTAATDGTANFYVNGALSGTADQTTTALSGITTTNALTIGNRSTATDRTFDGNIDEPRIWNRVLTATEISNLYFLGTYSTTGLVSEYLFDEGAGSTVTDTSPIANNGTITSATYSADVPMTPRPPVRNIPASLYFNNTTNGGITIPYSASLSPTTGCGLEMWFRPVPKTNNDVSCILFDNTDSGVGNSFLLQITAAGVPLAYMTSGAVARNLTTATATVKFNEWNFIGAGYTGSAWNIYLNGAQIATMAATGSMSPSAQALRIGQYYSGSLVPTQGYMSGVRVYSRSYTLQDHQNRYYKNLDDATMRTGLVLDMPLTTGAGLTATDVSGSGNNGTFTTPVWSSDTPSKRRKQVNESMVKNGDFEYAPPFTAATSTGSRWVDGTSGGSATNDLFNWYLTVGAGAFAASFDSSTKYAGSYSLKLEATNSTGRGRVTTAPFEITTTAALIAQYGIRVSPSTDYDISGYIKTATASASSVRIQVLYYTEDGAQSGGSANTSFQAATQDFTLATVRFSTASTTRYIVVKLEDNTASGAAHQCWFDDVKVLPVYPEGRVPADGNLVKNFDFEVVPTFVAATATSQRWIDGSSGGSTTNATYKWGIAGGGTFAGQFDSSVAHGGVTSMKLSTTATASQCSLTNTRTTNFSDVSVYGIRVLPNTSYTMTGWMKTNYVSGDATNGAALAAVERDAAGASITTNVTTYVKTTTDWTQYTSTFTTAANTVYVNFDHRVYGHQGTATLIMDAWFDDIYLAPTTNPGRIQIT